ncbi:MAG: hypothetical protein ACRC17_12140 [Culicoidibacterales bacterium]
MKVIGIDLGNGYIKTANPTISEEKSVFCYTKEQVTGQKGISINGSPKKLFGRIAEQSGYPLRAILGESDSERYHSSDFYDMIIANTTHDTDVLVLGLPNSHYKTHKQILIDNIKGKEFKKDNQTICIEHVLVVPQPLGTYVASNVEKNEKVLVVDIGHGTVDYSVIKNEEIIADFSVNNGMKKTFPDILQYVQTKFPDFETELITVPNLLIDGVRFGGVTQSIAEDKEVQEILATHLETITQKIVDHFGSFGSFDKIIFSGGGAITYKNHIELLAQKHINIMLADNAQTANVRGFKLLGEIIYG